MKPPKKVPVWLRRLGQVKAELRGVRFPRTAEEGLQQTAELSATSLRILKTGTRSAPPTRILLARMSQADARQSIIWRKERARSFGRSPA